MAHKARAASFPPSPLSSESPTPSPPAPPTGTTPAATFPPLPPLQWRCLHTAQHRPALHGPSRRRRRVRHLRRHFCRWCKLFHVDASSRWRRSRRGKDGDREEALPSRASLSPLCTFPFSHATASRRAERRSDGAARRAGSEEAVERQFGRALSRGLRGGGRVAVAVVVVLLRLLEKRKRYRSSCPPSSVVCFSPVCEDRRPNCHRNPPGR